MFMLQQYSIILVQIRKSIKKLLDDIAKELAPKFEYKTFQKTITTVKEIDERNKDGILTGRKIKVNDTKKENEILLTEADSPYGHYKYTYEKVTEKKYRKR